MLQHIQQSAVSGVLIIRTTLETRSPDFVLSFTNTSHPDEAYRVKACSGTRPRRTVGQTKIKQGKAKHWNTNTAGLNATRAQVKRRNRMKEMPPASWLVGSIE